MTIQAINTNGVSANINTNFKYKTNQIEKPKENVEYFNDNGKKVIVTLSGLAILSMAGIGIAVALRKGKATPPKDASNTIKDIQNTVNNLAQTANQPVTAPKIHINGQKEAAGIIQRTGGQTIRSAKCIPAERKPVSNVNRGGDPAGRSNSVKVSNKQAEAEARAAMLRKNDAVQQTLANANKSIISSAGDIKNAGQGIKNAADVQVLDKKAAEAQSTAQNIINRAQEMRNIAEEIPTHKNIKRAQTAQNKAIRAQLDADKVQKKVDEKKVQISLDAAKKEQNIQRMIDNTTPERLLEGQRKMEANAQKTSAKALQRKANKTVNRPGYQRALRQFQNYSSEKLQGVINSTKSSNIERIAAQDLLDLCG